MTRQQISDSGFLPIIVPSRGRHHDLFGIGTAVAGGVQAIASVTAARLQAEAAQRAADLQAKSAADSLGFQRDVFNTQQENQKPWLEAGKTALGQLSAGTAPGGIFTKGYGKTFNPAAFDPGAKFDAGAAFSAPDSASMKNDPGYQFRLQEGQKALERSAAARGVGTGGAALKAVSRYGQDYASNEYGNVYNRALNVYQTNFGNRLNAYQTNFGNSLNAYGTNYNTQSGTFDKNYNVWASDTGNQYNRLAALSGVGQTANQQLAASGNQAAANVANINQASSNAIGEFGTQAGNAYGAGIVGVSNAFNNYMTNMSKQSKDAQELAAYRKMYGG